MTRSAPEPPTARRGTPEVFSAFQVSAFRWIWSSVLLAGSGQYVVMLVAGYEAYALSHSPFWSSVVAMAIMLPTIVVGPVAGGLADRANRVVMMMIGMGLAGTGCLAMTIAIVLHRSNLGLVVATAALAGCGMAIQNPSWQAILPGLLGIRRLVNGSLLSRVALQGSEMSGPLIGTWVLATQGPAATFALAAAFYYLGMGTIWYIRALTHARNVTRESGIFSPVARGFAYVVHRPALRLLMLFVFLHCSLTMAFTGLLPALAKLHLGGGSTTYGVLLTALGLGAVGGPLGIAFLGSRLRSLPALFITAFLSGLTLVALGFTTSYPIAVIMAIAAGASEAVFMALIYALTQSITEDTMRGRVASFQLLLTAGSMGIASFVWGWLATAMSVALVLAVPGLVFTIAALLFLRVLPALRVVARETA